MARKSEQASFCLPEKCSIENAAEYRDRFLDLLKGQRKAVLDLSGVTHMDLSFFQVLYSFCRTAVQHKSFKLSVEGEAGPGFLECLYYSGIIGKPELEKGADILRILSC